MYIRKDMIKRKDKARNCNAFTRNLVQTVRKE